MAHGSIDHLHAPRRQWWLVFVCGVVTLVAGTIGLTQYEHEHHPNAHHGLSAIYHAAQMFLLHAPHFDHGVNGWIETGRWFGLVTLALGTATVFWRRLQREFRFFQLSQWSGHHVICGLGAKGFEIVRCLKKQNPAVQIVVLDPAADSHLVEACEEYGVCLIAEDASKPDILSQARVAYAGEIVVITPTDEANVRIADAVRAEYAKVKPSKLPPCHIHLADINLREELQKWCESAAPAAGGCPLHFFDVFDDEARRVLRDLPLDGPGLSSDDPRTVHVVVLGFGRMGRSIALRAAKMGHFANGRLLRISIIDRQAHRQRERFLFRYPALELKTVCDLQFHEIEAESLATRKRIEQWAAEADTILHVFQCLDFDARDLEVGLRLRTLLGGREHCNLRVRFHSRHSLAQILEAGTEGARLVAFGMVEDACCDEAFRRDAVDRLARGVHELFVDRRRIGSQRTVANDSTLRSWEMLAEDIRESNRQQADHIAIKLRAIGCELADLSDARKGISQFQASDVERLAEMEHRRWNAERWLAGWRYGTPSNKARRINENLVPWADLPESVRDFDREAVRDIPALAGLMKPAKKVVARAT